jgi:hypothetical protein
MQAQPVQYGGQGQSGQYGMQGQPGATGPPRGQAPMPGGYPTANSHQGPVGFEGPMGHPGPAGQHGRMGQQRPGYRYPGPDGYGENLNGGDYAYVINEDGGGAARRGRPRGPERRTADESRPRADRHGQASTDSLRAITAGAAGLTRSADPSADAGHAYGRDDPAYGPPGPDWYSKAQVASDSEQAAGEPAEQTPQTARAETVQAAAARAEAGPAAEAKAAVTGPIDVNPHVVRGPFEPLVETAGQTSAPDAAGADHGTEGARARAWGDGHDVGGGTAWSSADDDLDAAPAGLAEHAPASYEFPGIADDDPAGSADAALDRLKALHLTAAAVAPQSLDAHFDQLLERQRKLISEYLGQTGGQGKAAATGTSTSAAAADDSLVGLGDEHRSVR